MRPLLGLLLLFGCVCVTARSAEGEFPRSEVDVLLRLAVQLRLTASQVEQLERIEIRRWDRSERARIDRRVRLADATGGQVADTAFASDEAARAAQQLEDSDPQSSDIDERASAEARALLDADQLAAAKPYLRSWHRERAKRLREE